MPSLRSGASSVATRLISSTSPASVRAGCTMASLETGLPIIFGVLTVETVEQALERAATTAGNKGGESMDTALEMISLMKQL